MKQIAILISSFTVSIFGLMLLSAGAVNAQAVASMPSTFGTDVSQSDACDGLKQLDSTQSCGTGAGQSGVDSVVKTVVQILSMIIGIAAVVMIIVAGFRYITSNGDSNNISSAKNTLIYALVGLAVAALAQFLVHFVINSVKT